MEEEPEYLDAEEEETVVLVPVVHLSYRTPLNVLRAGEICNGTGGNDNSRNHERQPAEDAVWNRQLRLILVRGELVELIFIHSPTR